MTKAEAKKWVCVTAAALLRSDLAMSEVVDYALEDDRDEQRKIAAFDDLIRELERRGE
jgi:hypothetical protein